MIVSASDLDDAIKKLRTKILECKEHLLDGVMEAYLDDIIQINSFPEDARILKYQSVPEITDTIDNITLLEDVNPNICISHTETFEKIASGKSKEKMRFRNFLSDVQESQ